MSERPTIADLIARSGLRTLGEDPPPDTVAAAVRNLADSLNGADAVSRAAARAATIKIVRPLGWRTRDVDAALLPRQRSKSDQPAPKQSSNGRSEVRAITLESVHSTYRKWLGEDYDLDAIDAVLCTLAAERLDGDPLWLLIVSGSGNAKTETVQSAAGVGAHVISMVTSEAALLSGAKHEKGATGGMLCQIGVEGVLVIKDVTSILSMHRDKRAGLLAALREIHDGYWRRDVGTEGGKTLQWRGRIAIIGAVTTAWDRAYDVIASMGDRFVLLRMDSTQKRTVTGKRAMRNTGDETRMREELAEAVAGVLAGAKRDPAPKLTDAEIESIVDAADLVTLARTGVEYDYRGDVIDAHAPEMPTRFAKQLGQLVRGGIAIGMDRDRALRLAIRCARDSMPPLRLQILLDVHKHPYSRTSDVRRRLEKPWTTIDRQLQSLHMLGVLTCIEEEGDRKSVWRYSVAAGRDPAVLGPLSPELSGRGVYGVRDDISGETYDRAEREAIQAENAAPKLPL